MNKKYLNFYTQHCQAFEYLKYFIIYSKTFESVLASIISVIPDSTSIFLRLNKHGVKQVAKLASFIFYK